MRMPQCSGSTDASALLGVMANEIAGLEHLAATTADWQTSRNLGRLAEAARDLLDHFMQLPGLLDGIEPWRPENSR
ncbi:hypothetical protein NOVOSPHI9U_110010 [Novosphingobium sp. 9U]|nr:hypothetical protein NOVOSPHI9U_110010 [Novosphingobium sp. 9U]